MESFPILGEKEWLACCGSTKFAQEMASGGPFSNYQEALDAAADIWFNKVDVNGWLEAFDAHPQIGQSHSQAKSPTSAQWSKGEQSTALATATDSTLQELYEWNTRYKQKFGFVFLICASGRSTPEILAEMKRRYQNRPIVEFELAAKEQMKITELRLSKLLSTNAAAATTTKNKNKKAGREDRVSIIGGHLTAGNETPTPKPSQTFTRTRPPITTHVLDVARGAPASGIEVYLEKWENEKARPVFNQEGSGGWKLQGSSITDKDGRSGHLMNMVDALIPGVYRISFDTGKYNPEGFFPFVSIVFEAIKEKLNDMGVIRKAKAEAKEEEKAEKELAKARLQVAHEVRLAREAEATMDLHVNKAAEKVAEQEQKQPHHVSNEDAFNPRQQDSSGWNCNPINTTGASTDSVYGGGDTGYSPQDTYAYGGGNTVGTGGYRAGNRTGGSPTDLL